jgi:hypothetical protein
MKRMWLLFAGLMAVAPSVLGQAKDFPNKPVRVRGRRWRSGISTIRL